MTDGYADMQEVYRQLGINSGSPQPGEAEKIVHLQALDDALTLAFDGKARRTWRGTDQATTRRVEAHAYPSDLLALPAPVLSVSQVVTDGVWNGTTFAGGTTQPTTAYWLPSVYTDEEGRGWALQSLVGSWSGVVLVTAVWGDTALLASVPLDVKRALTLLVIGEYRRETMNARQTQADFDPLNHEPAPNPWNQPEVKAALARYTLVSPVLMA